MLLSKNAVSYTSSRLLTDTMIDSQFPGEGSNQTNPFSHHIVNCSFTLRRAQSLVGRHLAFSRLEKSSSCVRCNLNLEREKPAAPAQRDVIRSHADTAWKPEAPLPRRPYKITNYREIRKV